MYEPLSTLFWRAQACFLLVHTLGWLSVWGTFIKACNYVLLKCAMYAPREITIDIWSYRWHDRTLPDMYSPDTYSKDIIVPLGHLPPGHLHPGHIPSKTYTPEDIYPPTPVIRMHYLTHASFVDCILHIFCRDCIFLRCRCNKGALSGMIKSPLLLRLLMVRGSVELCPCQMSNLIDTIFACH